MPLQSGLGLFRTNNEPSLRITLFCVMWQSVKKEEITTSQKNAPRNGDIK
jgi:hypothetical protein